MSKPRFICEVCGKPKKGAHTDLVKKESTANCPLCVTEGVNQKYAFIAHVDSDGRIEMIIGKCPKHGEIKRLGKTMTPAFQRNYIRWMTNGATEAPPRIRREV